MRRASATPQEEWSKLTASERAAWAGFIRAHATLIRALDAELEATHQLPMSSFDVLIQLAIAPGGRLQMFQLADAVHLSRSGLSRLVERLEREGMVERRKGVDPRSVFAVITDTGLARVAEATPTHLNGVRRRFLDRLSPAQIEQLATIWRSLLLADDAARVPEQPGLGTGDPESMAES